MDNTVVGIDECGIGALAGPLIVCGYVPNNPDDIVPGVRDSKTLSRKQRDVLCRKLRVVGTHRLASVGSSDIDRVGVRVAWCQAASSVIHAFCKLGYSKYIIDGNTVHQLRKYLHDVDVSLRYVVKADSLCYQVSAASIVGKSTRDAIMDHAAKTHADFAFASHSGYGTPRHIAEIREHGLTPIHRATFCGGFTARVGGTRR